MARGLVIVDIQNDYFPGGANPLDGPEAAAAQAARLLARFREHGEPLVHMQHVWDAPDAAFMAPGTAGVEIHESVAPRPGEAVIENARVYAPQAARSPFPLLYRRRVTWPFFWRRKSSGN